VRPSNICLCAGALALALCTNTLVPAVLAQPAPGSGGHAPGARPGGPYAPTSPSSASGILGAPLGGVRPAAHFAPAAGTATSEAISPTPAERIYYEGPEPDPILGDLDVSCGPGGCNHCGRFGPGSSGPFGQGCLCNFYVRGEYLLWGTRGMNLPALVTTSPDGTDQNDAGVLGVDGTEILFGGDTVNSNVRSGGRITIGWWFDSCRRLGIEGDYFGLEDRAESFRESSDGTPILARPFYDIVSGEENSSLTAFPNLVRGEIDARAETQFYGGGVRAIYNLCCGDGCGTSCITCCPVPTGYRFDAIIGYRYLRLSDEVSVVEQSTSLETAAPGSFFITDVFDTENDFNGVDLGTSWSWCKGCFSVDLLSKIALGNTRSRINIRGNTTITENGQSESFNGGILAQRTNIGDYEADEFAVVPELGVTLGYQLNPCWRVTAGYSFIYWSRVARAGDQIDQDINPDLFPPEQVAVTTHLRPEFNLHYQDFWAQGLTLGLEGSW
jgi:hypothetical protein